jgi:glyoxylase-like metal-dependent hydrolase (beta-lactamase superfamily II)
MKKFRVGAVQIATINTGDLLISLKDMEKNVSEEEISKYPEVFGPKISPTYSILISDSRQNILIDPGSYSVLRSYEDFETLVPSGYEPPPNLETQLRSIGVTPEQVDNVVITHAHFDHYSGVSRKKDDGMYVPAFPNARYLLGKADWEDEMLLQKALRNKESGESHTLGILHSAGLLDLVSERRTLDNEVEIIPSPGESPGHQIIRVHSSGEALYCVGDLFHDPAEVENISWMATWCEPKTIIESRKWLIENAIKENALVLASHMPIGKIAAEGNGKTRFVPEA